MIFRTFKCGLSSSTHKEIPIKSIRLDSISVYIISFYLFDLDGSLPNNNCESYIIAWWWLWNFILSLVEFKRFFHPNLLPEIFFFYLVRQILSKKLLRFVASKIGFENWKCPIFDYSDPICFTRCQKNHSKNSLRFKIQLNLT